MFLINAYEPPRAFELRAGDALLIGRGEHCDIQLDDPSASRVHCRVRVRDGRVILTDAGSRWGTFVNGDRIEQYDLGPGDRVRVGETLFVVSAEEHSGATTIAPVEPATPPSSPVPHRQADDPDETTSDHDRSAGNENHKSPVPFVNRFQPQNGNQLAAEHSRRVVEATDGCERKHNTPAAVPAYDARPFVPARFVGKTFQRYQVESLIAHSRTGLVFLANDPALKRRVVIKVYRPELLNNDEAIARFLRAVRTMINFRHPNIVRLFDAGQHDGLCCTITEHIDGVTAAELIKNFGIAGMLDWRTTLRIGLDLCDALQELHSHGVVHRDIRPGHIIISNKDRRAAISEVVLAKSWNSEQLEQLTAAGDIIGDLAWQAPEQLGSGEPIDQRTDIYQLGLTLYSLLTGASPFSETNPARLVQRILTEPAASPKSHQLSTPDLLSDAVLTALEKRPSNRHQSAPAFRAALERAQRFTTTPSP